MFKWLMGRNPSVEQQLGNLLGVGIRLRGGIDIKDCLDGHQKEYIKRPYILLLISIGSEIISDNDQVSFPSEQVWHLDRECIEDHGDYARVIQRISEMVKDEIIVDQINDFVDVENNIAQISFNVNGHPMNLL